jgi:hypothetical protein
MQRGSTRRRAGAFLQTLSMHKVVDVADDPVRCGFWRISRRIVLTALQPPGYGGTSGYRGRYRVMCQRVDALQLRRSSARRSYRRRVPKLTRPATGQLHWLLQVALTASTVGAVPRATL